MTISISAAAVKKLRDRTGCGMMDCKTALQESEGDLERAVDLLRSKGLARAAKRGGRETVEGAVAAYCTAREGVLIELNSETDFVARNEKFSELVMNVAEHAYHHGGGNLAAFSSAPWDGAGSETVDAHIQAAAAVLGENLRLRRLARLGAENGLIASYIHNPIAPGMGRIGVLAALECAASDHSECAEFGKKIAMHIAASSPLALSPEALDRDVVARERAVLLEEARAGGKPEAIIEKIVQGRLNKYFKDVTLMSQPFVFDPDITVGEAATAAAAQIGASVTVTGFVRFQLGEAIPTEG